MPHPLTKALNAMFRPTSERKRAARVTATRWQVYTDAVGSDYRHVPAYDGHDRAEAERIAALVGGSVESVR